MRQLQDNSGSALMVVLVLLLAITAIGFTLMDLSNYEQDMASTEKSCETNFFEADTCVYVTAKFLSWSADLMDKGQNVGIPEGDPLIPGIRYPASVTALGFYNKIMMPPADADSESFFTDVNGEQQFLFEEDLGFDVTRLQALADIRPQKEEASKGTAANVQNYGYSAGVGLGGAGGGGVNEWFIITCMGQRQDQTTNGQNCAGRVNARYRWNNLPGGL